jgi:nifR3 family TIM-barrel protein
MGTNSGSSNKGSVNIGKVKIEGFTALGPMAGVTDPPFRLLCKEQGVSLLYTEMVSAKGIHYNNKNTKDLLFTEPEESPVALQLFGSEPEIMAETAKRIEELPFDILDINMGCPVPKIVNNGEGSALMKDPALIGRIVEAVSKATVKPVTVKLRKGFAADIENAAECAYIAQESGAVAVAVHGRTREQYYSGKADWDCIKRVKERVSVPVIGNGDVRSFEDAAKMLYLTGCDMVMIGRGAEGNPWVFAEINAFAECFESTDAVREAGRRLAAGESLGSIIGRDPNEIYRKPSWETVRTMIMRHAKELCKFKGEDRAIPEMRRHVCSYTAGFPGSAKLRAKVSCVTTLSELNEILPVFF